MSWLSGRFGRSPASGLCVVSLSPGLCRAPGRGVHHTAHARVCSVPAEPLAMVGQKDGAAVWVLLPVQRSRFSFRFSRRLLLCSWQTGSCVSSPRTLARERWLKARGVCAASRCDRDEGRCAALQVQRHRPVPGAEQHHPPCTAARGGMQLRPPSPLQWLCICIVKPFPPAGRPVPAAPQPRRAPASCSPALPGQAVGA